MSSIRSRPTTSLRRRFVSSALASALVLSGVVPVRAAEPEKKAPSTLAEQITGQVASILKQSRGAVCRVVSEDNGTNLSATGFFIDAEGTFVTTYAVAGEAENILVGEEQFSASRLGRDARANIAILKVETGGNVPYLKLAKSEGLAPGSPVVALGYPIDLDLSPSFGIVAEHNIGFNRRYFATRHIRANLAVQRGQMGSPLLNFNGDVEGVILSVVEDRSGVFALPVDAIIKARADIQHHGRVRQGWFGTDVHVAEAILGSTARVTDVRKGSPGERAGLLSGDVLLQMGTWKITNPEDVLSATYYLTADEPLKVRIARGGQERELIITPADPPNGELPTADNTPPAVTVVSEGVPPAK